MVVIEQLDHIALAVTDLERSIAWYSGLLGLERRYEQWQIPVMLCAGGTCLALFPADSTPPLTSPDSARIHGLRHFAFRVSQRGLESAQEELRSRGIDFDFQDHEISHSIYFFDPDGYQVELTTYEL